MHDFAKQTSVNSFQCEVVFEGLSGLIVDFDIEEKFPGTSPRAGCTYLPHSTLECQLLKLSPLGGLPQIRIL
jgi:hypothetical protein